MIFLSVVKAENYNIYDEIYVLKNMNKVIVYYAICYQHSVTKFININTRNTDIVLSLAAMPVYNKRSRCSSLLEVCNVCC